jgi:hypothetical protein
VYVEEAQTHRLIFPVVSYTLTHLMQPQFLHASNRSLETEAFGTLERNSRGIANLPEACLCQVMLEYRIALCGRYITTPSTALGDKVAQQEHETHVPRVGVTTHLAETLHTRSVNVNDG